MKTYYIMISKQFMKGHPRAGEPTHFREKIEWAVVQSEEHGKIHTMRENYEHWAHVAEEVNAGRGILSLRQWTGSPYNYQQDGSKQKEFLQLTKIGVQRVSITKVQGFRLTSDDIPICFDHTVFIDGKLYMGVPIVAGSDVSKHANNLPKNDGLSLPDFRAWFRKPLINGAIIHFTQFRY